MRAISPLKYRLLLSGRVSETVTELPSIDFRSPFAWPLDRSSWNRNGRPNSSVAVSASRVKAIPGSGLTVSPT